MNAVCAGLLLVALTSGNLTPAETKIAAAELAIARSPERYEAYNDLAMAYARRARETADPRYYERALETLETSFRIAPDNYAGLRVRAWALLGLHDYRKALAIAERLNRKAPDDVMVYGMLTDAYVELGRYDEAEEAAQWMLDLRPGNVAGLTRGAYLREIFGDVSGAIEWMQAAFEQTPFHETEDRAWVLTHIAHLERSRGAIERAEAAATDALAIFPDYHYALAELAKIRLAQERTDDAVRLLRKRYQIAPHPENLYDVAVALKRAGVDEQAHQLFEKFEAEARTEMTSWDNANRELVFYYADVAREAGEALVVAREEVGRRRDVWTLDAYAWALFANGKLADAWTEIHAALASGIRDARLFYHAGRIALARGDAAEAERWLRKSLEANPHADVASDARAELKEL